MTLEKARRLIRNAERINLTVLNVYAQLNRAGGYLLVIETIEGSRLIFADSMKAYIALAELSGKRVREDLRYFALGEDGIPRECNAEDWVMDLPHRKAIEITCSPQITAVIRFVGLALPDTGKKAPKLWAVNLNLGTEVSAYSTELFGSFEQARTFVNEYIAKGRPVRSAFRRFRAEYHRRNSRESKTRKGSCQIQETNDFFRKPDSYLE
jgi:hypothetical protein